MYGMLADGILAGYPPCTEVLPFSQSSCPWPGPHCRHAGIAGSNKSPFMLYMAIWRSLFIKARVHLTFLQVNLWLYRSLTARRAPFNAVCTNVSLLLCTTWDALFAQDITRLR